MTPRVCFFSHFSGNIAISDDTMHVFKARTIYIIYVYNIYTYIYTFPVILELFGSPFERVAYSKPKIPTPDHTVAFVC